MIFGLLFQIVLIGLVVIGVRKLRAGGARDGIHGVSIRRFFQYSIMYGLVIIVAMGFSGLLARVISKGDLLISNQTELARNTSFVIVGLPLYIGVVLWTRRQYRADPKEAKSFGWSFYFTLTTLTFLVGTALGMRQALSWATGIDGYDEHQFSQFIIWGIFWAAHWWVNHRLTAVEDSRPHNLLGALLGLGFLVVGLIELISGALERLLNFGGGSLFISQRNSLLEGVLTALIGAVIWALYWLGSALKSKRDAMWLAYVMLVGAGGGLVMAVISLTTLLYNWLVWIFGTPNSTQAWIHFRNVPTASACVVVGSALWIYHRAVLHDGQSTSRTEVRRVYEYLMSGIGLVASGVGLAIVLVAFIDALTESERIAGAGSRNTLLLALTLLVVGCPVWWIYWSRIERILRLEPDSEHASPSRRVYLFLLFGIGGITAVVTLLVGVFFLFDDIFKGNFGEETVRRIRIPLSMLLTTGGVAGYHWMIYRGERDKYSSALSKRRLVILIGPHDHSMVRDVGERASVKVQALSGPNTHHPDWNLDNILRAVRENNEGDLLVVSTLKGLQVTSLG